MFTSVDPKSLDQNVFSLIGDQWMLITAGTGEACNTMTASWGGLGVIWGAPAATCYIRPQRYTKEFVDREEYFTLTFFSQEYRKALSLCGSKSGREIDKVKGLDIGADDYMTKPFGVMELISRVKAMLRRSAKPEEKEKILRLGNIVLDREKHAVFVNDAPCELTYKEYELLKLLMTNAGIVTTREVILDRIWGIDFEGESRTLDMHIKTLRQKLKEEGSLIKTVRNVGYIMNGDKV